jgi:aminoglycoside phosphotransferase (APT) family kinase protein
MDLPGLDLPAVVTWLDAAAPGLLAGPPRATLIAGGRSNLTYLLDDGTRRFVLRRPPLGHVLATAHDMGREYRVIRALAGGAVPVPQPLAECTDTTITGAPFYLMAHVDGMVLRRRDDLAGLDQAARDHLARAMMDVLARLHAVDVDAAGLADFGRPEGFMARQVRRWSAQLEASRSRDLPGIEALRDALAADVPEPAPGRGRSVVHGDYRLDNLVVAPPQASDPLAVRAVLDWEMATVGDPLADLGLLLAYWDGLGRIANPVVDAVGPGAGFPDGDTLADWYAQADVGPRVDLGRLPWYVGFGYFKIAVILEGIHYRFSQGQTVGSGFDRIGEVVPALIDLGRATLARSDHP